jgi:CubicO group peptidase (beta-lactamase class C family)
MQQVEQGKIDIDTDINNYIPIHLRNTKFPDKPLTARMLMTHTSGVAWPQEYYEAKGLWDQFPPDSAPSLSEWVPQFLVPGGEHYNPATWKDTEPGTFELYSNIGTCLQAYIVEQISGMDYRDYCKKHIFDPLHMMSTSYWMKDLDSALMAKRYNIHDNSVYEFQDDRLFASGLLKTSVNDFTKFLAAIINDGRYQDFQLLEEESIRKVLELQNPASGTSLIWHANIGDWRGHTGGINGVSTTAEIHKNDKVGMIIFCNTNSGSVYPGHDIYWLVRQKANEYR